MSERRTVEGMSADQIGTWVRATPVPGPTRTSRCPEGECDAIINVHSQANPDRDGNYMLCAYCDEPVCVLCHRGIVLVPGDICDDCQRGDAWSEFEEERHSMPGPSTVTHTRWLRLETPDARELKWKHRGEARTGNWLIFSGSWEQHDANWRLIVGSLEKLGGAAAASTRQGARRDGGIILVTTQDADDLDDVKRVLIELRDLGFTGSLSYKADADAAGGSMRGPSRYSSPAKSRWVRDLREKRGEATQ